jgi:hypothetical protein
MIASKREREREEIGRENKIKNFLVWCMPQF